MRSRHWFLVGVVVVLVGAVSAVALARIGSDPEPETWFGTAFSAQAVTFSPDGRTLAVGEGEGQAGQVSLWDVAARRRTAVLTSGASVWSVAFSPDGRTLAATVNVRYGSAAEVRLWEVATRRPTGRLAPDIGLGWAVTFSPDGRTVAVGGADGTTLWDVATGKSVRLGRPGVNMTTGVAYAADGRTLVVGRSIGGHGDIEVWDVPARKVVRTLTSERRGALRAVAISPDRATIAGGEEYGGMAVWDARTGARVAALNTHYGDVTELDFSPDGRTLLVGTTDRKIRLWDVRKRRTARTWDNDARVLAAAYSPDGGLIATGGGDKIVRLWRMTD